VEPDETTEEAARRELWEETGQSNVQWGCLVARREGVFDFLGATYLSIEDFYVAHTTDLQVRPAGLTDIEIASVEEYRWLDATDLRRLSEPVYPAELPSVLPRLAAHDYPQEPWSWSE